MLPVIWASSLVAALLFLAAGFFWARSRAAATLDGETRALNAQIARMQHEITRLEAEAARIPALERDVAELPRLRQEAAELPRLRQEAAQIPRLRETIERAERDLQSARNTSSAAAGQAVSTAQEETKRAKKRILELEQGLTAARAELGTAVANQKKAESAVEEERKLSQHMEKELERVRGGMNAARTEGGGLRREMALLGEEAAMSKRALEVALTENAALRRDASILAEVRRRLATVEAENARLRATDFAARSRDWKPTAEAPASDDIAAGASTLDGRSLQRFVDDVAQSPAVSAAALTDELGFLVAGNGDHTEALAAFGAYLTEAGARACGVLPMHAVHRVSIQDDSGITLTARTVVASPNELVLVTLGVQEERSS
jgi:hypothetical protein